MIKENQNLVLLETFREVPIFYDKENDKLVAIDKERELDWESTRLWDIKGQIKESKEEAIEGKAFIPGGLFERSIQLIELITYNSVTKVTKYKILDETDHDYNIGKTKEGENLEYFGVGEHNQKLFDEVRKLQEEIWELEKKQGELVRKLI